MTGKKEGTVEGLMRKCCKTSGLHNELWARQLAMADTIFFVEPPICTQKKNCMSFQIKIDHNMHEADNQSIYQT